jgi:hypothetical protein
MGQASTYFFDANDAEKQTLHKRITPSDSQFEEQQARWNALADFLVDDLNKQSGYQIRTWLQGSYKFATQVRPVHKGDEFDIDLGIYFCWDGDRDDGKYRPKELKQMVQAGLRRFKGANDDVVEVVEPPKPRCCRVRFRGDFHIDVPCYHLDEQHDARSLATEDDTWEDSDPKAIYVWFKNQFEDYERVRVRRLIRYLKAWAALKFKEGQGRPSSLFLTVLVAEATRDLEEDLPGAEDEALAVILQKITERLNNNRKVANPADPEDEEDLAARLSDDEWRTFVRKLGIFSDRAAAAISDDDVIVACSRWSAEFEHLFPLPEEQELDERTAKLPAVVTQPEVRVYAVSRDNTNLRYTGVNAIGPIPKNCSITFEVTNALRMPAGTTFYWMVRNEGDEAEDVNDLGHKAGTGLRAEEHSAYSGRHFMDCTAVAGDRIVGLRRVQVTIRGMAAPKRNPPKPAYVKIRGRR